MTYGRPTKYKKKYINEMFRYFKESYENYLAHDFSEEETVGTKKNKDGQTIKITKKKKKLVELPTVFGFAIKIGVHTGTISEWAKKYPEFSDALRLCKQMTADLAIQGAANNLINPAVAKLIVMNSSDWRDQKDIDMTSSDGSMAKPAVIEILPVSTKETDD